MKSHFTPHFINYITNYYKIFSREESFILQNFNLLNEQIYNNNSSFLLNKHLAIINETKYYEFYFLKNKLTNIITTINNKDILQVYGLNELKIRETAAIPAYLIPKIDNQYLGILNTLKYIYKNIDQSFAKLKLFQLFEVNYKLTENDSNYFKYLSYMHYDINSDMSENIPKYASNLFILERFLEILFKSMLNQFEYVTSDNLQNKLCTFYSLTQYKDNNNITHLVNDSSSLDYKILALNQKFVSSWVNLKRSYVSNGEKTSFIKKLSKTIIKNVLFLNNSSDKYSSMILDLFTPQSIPPDKLKTKYSHILLNLVDLVNNSTGILASYKDETIVKVTYLDGEFEFKTIESIRYEFLEFSELSNIETLLRDFLSHKITKTDKSFYKLFIFEINKTLQKYLIANFLIKDYNLIPIQSAEHIDEGSIYNYIKERLSDASSIIKQLEYISYQFNTEPLYFFNSHYYIYEKYLNSFINELALNDNLLLDPNYNYGLSNNNIQAIISNFNIDSTITNVSNGKSIRDKLFELITASPNNDPTWSFSNGSKNLANLLATTNIIEDTCNVQYINWIDQFIQSSGFSNYLMTEFFPKLINIAKLNNPISDEIILSNLDDIKKYIKFLLIDNILNGPLFKEFTLGLKESILFSLGNNDQHLNYVFKNIDIITIEKALTAFKAYSPMDIDIYKEKMYNFYASAVFSELLTSLLNEYML